MASYVTIEFDPVWVPNAGAIDATIQQGYLHSSIQLGHTRSELVDYPTKISIRHLASDIEMDEQ